MYTYRDTQGGGGGGKIDNFFSYQTFVTAKYCMHWSRGGQGARTHPGKTQVKLDSIGNKQLDPPLWKKFDPRPPPPGKNVGAPLEPRKIIISFEKNPLAFCKISGVLLKKNLKKRCQVMTDGPGPPPPPPLTKIPGSAHVLIQILSYCCFI